MTQRQATHTWHPASASRSLHTSGHSHERATTAVVRASNMLLPDVGTCFLTGALLSLACRPAQCAHITNVAVHLGCPRRRYCMRARTSWIRTIGLCPTCVDTLATRALLAARALAMVLSISPRLVLLPAGMDRHFLWDYQPAITRYGDIIATESTAVSGQRSTPGCWYCRCDPYNRRRAFTLHGLAAAGLTA